MTRDSHRVGGMMALIRSYLAPWFKSATIAVRSKCKTIIWDADESTKHRVE